MNSASYFYMNLTKLAVNQLFIYEDMSNQIKFV